MAETNTSAFKEVYKKLTDKLSFITVNEQTVELLKKDKSFEASFEQQLMTLKKLETKLKIKDKKAPDLIAACNQITGKTEITAEAIDFKDPEDIEDNLHFLDVYLTNVLGEDFINKYIDNVKSKAEPETKKEENIETYETKIVDGEEVHDFSDGAAAAGAAMGSNASFNAEDFLRQNHVSAENMAEQLIMNQARLLLNRDIANNKIFKFDSKPKIVVWLKMINLGAFFSFILANAILIIMFLSSPITGIAVDSKIEVYGGGNVDIFMILALILVILGAGSKIFTEIKFFKNDNYRFSVKLGYMFWSILLFVWIMFWYVRFIKGYNAWDSAWNDKAFWFDTNKGWQESNDPSQPGYFKNTTEGYDILIGLYALSIISISIFGVMVILSCVLFAIRPKVDATVLQSRLNEYVQKIKSGQINLDDLSSDRSFGSPFGGMFF